MNVKPKSRLENLLAKIAGRDDAKEIKTKTKGEELLNEIAENGGGGGGANVLTLYLDDSGSPQLYKNIECTEGYSSVEEANEALLAAASIRAVFVVAGSIAGIIFPTSATPANSSAGQDIPMVYMERLGNAPVYIENSEPEEPEDPGDNDGGK